MRSILTLVQFSILALFALTSINFSYSGLPPTTLKGSRDTAAQTVFSSQVPYNQKTSLGGVGAFIETGNDNVLKNASFEGGTTDWTASAGTITSITDSTFSFGGPKHLRWASASNGDTLKSTAVITGPMGSVNMEVTCRAYAENVANSDFSLGYSDGASNDVILGTMPMSVGVWGTYTYNFVPGSISNLQALIKRTSAGAETQIKIDDCYVGPARNLGTTGIISDWAAYTPTITGVGTATGVAFYYRQVGNHYEINGTFTTGTTAASLASITLPNSYTVNTASVTIPANTTAAAGSLVGWYTGQSATAGNEGNGPLVLAPGTSTSLVYFGQRLDGGSVSNVLIPKNGNAILSNTDIISLSFTVPITQLTGTGTFTSVSQGPAYYSGYHDGTCAWIRSSTSFGDFSTDASCALTTRQSSGISCSATGGVLPAIACTLPRLGIYWVCGTPTVANSTVTDSVIRLWDGTTVIANGEFSGTTSTNPQVCGLYNATSLSPTFTLQGKKATSGQITIGGVDAGIQWVVAPFTPNVPTPLLVGSAVQPSAGVESIVRINGTCSASASVSSNLAGTSIGNIAAGACVITLPANFSSTPVCVDAFNSSSLSALNSNATTATSATSVTVYARDAVGALTTFSYAAICMGPK